MVRQFNPHNQERREMSWNYRVVTDNDKDEKRYWIHQVYYDDQGKPDGWVEDCSPFGFTKKELRETLKLMLAALNKPALIKKESIKEKKL